MRLGAVMEQSAKKAKTAKTFSMRAYHQRRVALKVAYLGWSYAGNTTQFTQGASEADLQADNTVEARLLEALLRVRLIASVAECGLSRCGRTDRGVSAWANVVSLVVRSGLSGSGASACSDAGLLPPADPPLAPRDCAVEIDYCRVLNKVLPDDVRVVAWSPVADDFDARFNARARTYRYYFLRDGMVTPPGTLSFVY